jgi:tetratricopeptide (TPR) repeat protein
MKKNIFTFYAIALILLCAAAYGLGLRNDMVFDDARLTDGTIFDRYGALWPIKQRLLSYGSFVWTQILFGDSTPVQRAINWALHIGAAAAVYALMRELLSLLKPDGNTEAEEPFRQSQQAALAVGMVFFLLAPVAAYAVGYLVQRAIVMATLFSALACWAYVRGLLNHGGKGPLWLVGAFCLYGLAVLSKEQSFLLAAMALPLYVYVCRPTWQKTLLVSAASLAVVTVGGLLLIQAYPSLLGQYVDDTSRALVAQLANQRPGFAADVYRLSVLHQAGLFFQYGLMWFLPYVGWMSIDLRPAFPLVIGSASNIVGMLAYVALFVICTVLIVRRSNTWGLAGLLLLFPLVLFWTEFATVWVNDPMVLYRSYLWAIPIPGLVALLLTGWSPKALYIGGAALALVFAALTSERMLSMESELTVWSDAIEKQGHNPPANAVGRYRAYMNRGAYYQGRLAPEAALRDFNTAHQLGEPTGGALLNAGISHQLLKRYADALRNFDLAEAAGYKDAPVYFHRAETLSTLQQFEAAATNYAKALALPQDAEVALQTRIQYADTLLRLGRYRDAAQEFELVVQGPQAQARHFIGLGMAQVGAKNGARALEAFNQAMKLERNALAHYGRAMAYATLGQNSNASAELDQALKLEPQNPAFAQLKQSWAKGVRPPMETP